MATNSHIEWTETTWNPVTGCSKISSGCKNCYAERMANRLKSMGLTRYRNGFSLTMHPDLVNQPLKWKKPRMIFVNSMSDLFHEKLPLKFIQNIFETMNNASWHTFQILTKRSKRMKKLAPELHWSSNIWMGVTVESPEYIFRIQDLKEIPALIKFLSIEPLLNSIPNLDLEGISWVIVGGESGPHARPMAIDWVREIRDQCIKSDVTFFFKQWGGTNKKRSGRILDGKTWDDIPQPEMVPG